MPLRRQIPDGVILYPRGAKTCDEGALGIAPCRRRLGHPGLHASGFGRGHYNADVRIKGWLNKDNEQLVIPDDFTPRVETQPLRAEAEDAANRIYRAIEAKFKQMRSEIDALKKRVAELEEW